MRDDKVEKWWKSWRGVCLALCMAVVLALLTGCGQAKPEAQSSPVEEAVAAVQAEKVETPPRDVPPAEPAAEPEMAAEEEAEPEVQQPYAAENVAGASALESHNTVINKKSATITVEYTLVQKEDGLAVDWHMTGAREKSGTSRVTDYDPETGTGTVAMPSGNFPFAVTGEPGSMSLNIDH